MKKKGIIISLIGIVFVLSLIHLLNVERPKYINYEGIMIALTVDGKAETSFPTSKNYSIDIECENADGRWSSSDWKLYVDNIKGNVACSLDFKSLVEDDKLKNIVEENATGKFYSNGDGSSRYSGKTPNNYITFNNELWRIIGVIPTCLNADCTEKEDLVKIIRSEAIGGLSFGTSSQSTYWGGTGNNDENALYKLLNEYYYGKKQATGLDICYGSANLPGTCEYEFNGISSSETDLYNKMIKSVYWNVGRVNATNFDIDKTYELETATRTVKAIKIGLLSASDYGYAGGDRTTQIGSLRTTVNNNWLYSVGYEWTITPASATNTVRIFPAGVIGNHTATFGHSVRPSLFLNSDVYVISGNGSATNPYVISLRDDFNVNLS